MAVASAGNIQNCDVLAKDTYQKTMKMKLEVKLFRHAAETDVLNRPL